LDIHQGASSLEPFTSGLGMRGADAEQVTKIKKQEGIIRGLLVDIDHLDATMRQFDPEHRARRPNTSRASIGRGSRGIVTKTNLDVLRR
jgi:hypothetical protein